MKVRLDVPTETSIPGKHCTAGSRDGGPYHRLRQGKCHTLRQVHPDLTPEDLSFGRKTLERRLACGSFLFGSFVFDDSWAALDGRAK